MKRNKSKKSQLLTLATIALFFNVTSSVASGGGGNGKDPHRKSDRGGAVGKLGGASGTREAGGGVGRSGGNMKGGAGSREVGGGVGRGTGSN